MREREKMGPRIREDTLIDSFMLEGSDDGSPHAEDTGGAGTTVVQGFPCAVMREKMGPRMREDTEGEVL